MAKSKHRRFSEIARLQYSQQGSEAGKHAGETANASVAYTVKVTRLETCSKRQIHDFFLSLELAKS